jgi:ElaB/YqjD/DUF883 family membrane-anchored ribosome-binding protein
MSDLDSESPVREIREGFTSSSAGSQSSAGSASGGLAGDVSTTSGTGTTGSTSGSPMDQAKETVQSVKEKSDQVIDTASSKASELGDRATEQADAGMEKAASGMDSLAGTLRDRGQSMGEGQLQSAAMTAADKLESGAEKLRQTDTDQLIAQLETFVRQKPVESLVIAAAAGYLFSKALR